MLDKLVTMLRWLTSAPGRLSQCVSGDSARRRFLAYSLLGAFVAFAVAEVGVGVFNQHYSIGVDWQKTRCLPWRVYFIDYEIPRDFQRGMYVAFRPDLDQMGLRFSGQTIGKMVGAVAGDRVEIKDDVAYVNGEFVGRLDLLEKLGAQPRQYDRELIVPQGKLFMVGTEPRSFDSRYWGFLDQSRVTGVVKPLF